MEGEFGTTDERRREGIQRGERERGERLGAVRASGEEGEDGRESL